MALRPRRLVFVGLLALAVAGGGNAWAAQAAPRRAPAAPATAASPATAPPAPAPGAPAPGAPAPGAPAPAATGQLRGQVIDARTGQPLRRVRVDLAGRGISVLTDADGRFTIDTTPGPATLVVSVVGYGLAKRDVVIEPARTEPSDARRDGAGAAAASPGAARAPARAPDLVIALAEGTGAYAEEVQVVSERFPRLARGVPMEQTVGSAELQNLKSTLADDPLRAIQALPGVAASDDFKSEFIVRGSDFRHVNVTLDGVPSPLLLHTVHNVTDSGSIAMINSDILDSVTLMSGSYPQRFGNRIGASVEFRTREGARDRPHVRVSASAINVSGVAEGPIGRSRRGSWLLSMRKSYMDWLVQRIDPNISGTFGFVDAHGTLAYEVAPGHTAQVSVVFGQSRFNERERTRGFNSLDVGHNRALLINASLRSTLTPSLVVTQRVYGIGGRFRNENPIGDEIARGTERDLSYRLDLTAQLRPRLALEAGGHLQWLRGTGTESIYGSSGLAIARRYTGTGGWQSAYGQLRWQAAPFFGVTAGGRVDRWTRTGEIHASPWIQTEIGLPRSFLVAAGTGLFRQAPDLDQILGPRGSIAARSERAWHGDAGIGQRLGAWRWQAAAYVRDEANVLRLPGIEPRVVDGRFTPESFVTRWENALHGLSRGVELLVQRRSTHGWSGWIGYAYAATRYRDPIRGETFAADVDQRHTLNLYGSYRLSDRTNVAGRFRTGSNVPLTGYIRQGTDDRYFLAATRNTLRLPAYARLDLRAARTYGAPGSRITLFVEVINVLNQGNVRTRTPQINANSFEVFNVTERLFPRLPSAGVTLEF